MDGRPLYESEAVRSITGPAIRPGSLDLTERAVSFCRLRHGSLVIDVGCGLGATVNHLQQNHHLRVVGVDLSPGMLMDGRRTFPEAPLVRGRAEHLPWPDRAAAAVICECVLSLTDDPPTALAEFYRVLKPGGYLILSDLYFRYPKRPDPVPDGPRTCCLQGATSKDRLLTRLEQAHFKVTLWEDHSDRLKQLAAGIVWEYGSLSRFPEIFGPCGSPSGSPNGSNDVSSTKPGYYMLTAQKEAL